MPRGLDSENFEMTRLLRTFSKCPFIALSRAGWGGGEGHSQGSLGGGGFESTEGIGKIRDAH